VTGEVDEHIDVSRADERCGLVVIERSDIAPAIDQREEPATHVIELSCLAEEDHLDARAVTMDEERFEKEGDGMPAKIGGYVADPQSPRTPRRHVSTRERLDPSRAAFANPTVQAGDLLRAKRVPVVGHEEQGVWMIGVLGSTLDGFEQMRERTVGFAPRRQRRTEVREGLRIVGNLRARALECVDRLFDTRARTEERSEVA